MWADYEYYVDKYLCFRDGVIPSDEFAYYERKAEFEVNRYVGTDIDYVSDNLKLCCCEVAELLYRSDKSGISTGVTSEHTGDLSVSYESAEARTKSLVKDIRSCVYRYLADTGLLYRGV